MKKIKSVINSSVFGGSDYKYVQMDIGKCLAIPFGLDSFSSIGKFIHKKYVFIALVFGYFKQIFIYN